MEKVQLNFPTLRKVTIFPNLNAGNPTISSRDADLEGRVVQFPPIDAGRDADRKAGRAKAAAMQTTPTK
ncbi:hypothetical protein NSU18_10730 [Paenibacillus sp. FSL H8-0048]|uniref:hypothetical protein n=1 Tax=Paenibacillus sp. FSL H8-0048 TaxID=2954508 RepID=UPI0030F620F1